MIVIEDGLDVEGYDERFINRILKVARRLDSKIPIPSRICLKRGYGRGWADMNTKEIEIRIHPPRRIRNIWLLAHEFRHLGQDPSVSRRKREADAKAFADIIVEILTRKPVERMRE